VHKQPDQFPKIIKQFIMTK